jgi:EmrB/QacA subfamily drug resistance transporter
MIDPSQAGPQRAESTPAVRPAESSKWLVLAAVGAGTFMSALDGSVVNTTLPLITQNFQADIATTEWVVTVYLLVLSGLLLSFGRLGDLHGHKRVYVAGFGIFLISSWLCGMAVSIPMLIVFRGVQALGAAMIASNSPAILTKSFPARQRGQALGLQATMTYLGLTVGPSLGGWLADLFSWRSIFYINIPVSLVAIYLSLRYISSEHPAGRSERFDLAGAAVFMAGLIALLFGLNQGHALGWTSPVILMSLLAALILLIIFVFMELRLPAPMLDLSLFKHPVFSGATISAVLNYICIYILIFLMPFYLTRGRELSLTQTGLLLTAMPLVMAVIAPISGALSDRIGPRWPTIIGMLFLAIGLYLLSGLSLQTPPLQIALYLGIAGLGTGIFISPNTSALLGAAPRGRQGIASGILATARNFGMVLGVGLAGATFNTALAAFGENPSPVAYASAVGPSFLVASGIAMLGLLVTLWRGKRADPS